MTTFKSILCTAAGAVGGAVVYLFGGWSEDLSTLIIFMSIDFLMGVVLALVFKNSNKTETGTYNSHAGWIGLSKKDKGFIYEKKKIIIYSIVIFSFWYLCSKQQ